MSVDRTSILARLTAVSAVGAASLAAACSSDSEDGQIKTTNASSPETRIATASFTPEPTATQTVALATPEPTPVKSYDQIKTELKANWGNLQTILNADDSHNAGLALPACTREMEFPAGVNVNDGVIASCVRLGQISKDGFVDTGIEAYRTANQSVVELALYEFDNIHRDDLTTAEFARDRQSLEQVISIAD
jgi:hypothetical protein